MNENIVVVTEENAQAVLIEESKLRPVLVDFWADWCEPCKNLMPILEKFAKEYRGDFLLAKVDTEKQQMLASQFGVRSLPTVVLMKDGQPLDGFAGALTETQVREFLQKHLPSPWQKKIAEAEGLLAQEKFSEAIAMLQPVYAESQQHREASFALTKAYIAAKRYDDAEDVLAKVKLVDQKAEYDQLRSQIELAKQAKRAPEIEALEQQLQAAPSDSEIAFQLAVQLSHHQFHKEALQHLYSVISRDLQFKEGEARKVYIDILAAMGKGDPVAVNYQRKLYTLLY